MEILSLCFRRSAHDTGPARRRPAVQGSREKKQMSEEEKGKKNEGHPVVANSGNVNHKINSYMSINIFHPLMPRPAGVG